jgi:outer membrane receptor protein involved in Fe transport
LTWRHLSGVDDGDEDVQYLVERIPSFDYFELGATYDFSSGITLIGGIRNLLDEDPPVLGGNSFEANTYPNLYDVFGRTFYGRATYKF